MNIRDLLVLIVETLGTATERPITQDDIDALADVLKMATPELPRH
jgi:hypothetical protein